MVQAFLFDDMMCQFRQVYGTKSSFVKIVSKFPLPRYRPEFDPRILQRHRISISPGTRKVLELALNTMKQKTGKDDWVHDDSKQRKDSHGNSDGENLRRMTFFLMSTESEELIIFCIVLCKGPCMFIMCPHVWTRFMHFSEWR